MTRKTINLWGHDFLVPAGDVECHSVIKDQVPDVNVGLKYCTQTNVCLQAGGNMGLWPYYLSGKFKTVYTFEPHPENFDCMVENLKGIENIKSFKSGLSDRPARVGIHGSQRNAGAYQLDGEGEIETITIDSLGLDGLDFLCLDIEGMEYHALVGGTETIDRFAPVVMIEDKGLSNRYGIEKGRCGELLATLGYVEVAAVHRDIVYVRK